MKDYTWSLEAFEHAKECYPEESCGLIIDLDGIETYWKCKNICQMYKEKAFVIDPLDYAAGEDKGEVLGIVHSHPDCELEFSKADRDCCKSVDLPFYIVEPKTESIIVLYPTEIDD